MNKNSNLVFIIFGLFIVIWFALLIAPIADKNLIDIISEINILLENPFHIVFCNNSIKITLFFILIYLLFLGILFSNKRNYRRGEEHGSAKWGNIKEVNKKYCQQPKSMNKILTKNVSISLDGKLHRRNLNVLLCGGSGAR